MSTVFHRSYAKIKRVLPRPLARGLRSFVAAFIGPEWQAYRSGHWRSAFAERAVDRSGHPLPWYSYPCIEFLKRRDFTGLRVLEFGGGQSTAWWSERVAEVVAMDSDLSWIQPGYNVVRIEVPLADQNACLQAMREALAGVEPFDVVVIDGLWRSESIPIARQMLKPRGAIIIDNSDWYGIVEAFSDGKFSRVDFCGSAPGLITPQMTSIFFPPNCFLFSAAPT